MRAASASTRITDPYRAGVVLGESLAELQPEVVFLFSSIHEAVPELLSGFYDGLEHDSTIVVGNTGDGCFETGGVSDFGAAALALIGGWLLAFTLSVDEFIIAFFTAGAGRSSITLPMQIYSMIRFGITPEINAISAVMLIVSVLLVSLSFFLGRLRR